MISCTEFIPAYSELFSFLESKYGRQEVDRFWKYLFVPDGKGIPLVNFVKREGIRGCFTYWAGTLNEEAADFTMYLNEKRGFFHMVMHKCPSKGRLLQLRDTIGIEPYHDYCLHCDSYRSAVEMVGLKYIYNFQGTENAAFSMLIYDPAVFDCRVIIDEDTVITDHTLQVTINFRAAVKHLHETGREVSKWYRYTTESVMAALAKAVGLTFTMERYDEATGAAAYTFAKKHLIYNINTKSRHEQS